MFDGAIKTFKDRLALLDAGFWSLYEQSGTRMKMLASLFYHNLHIVQLKVMYRLTSDSIFKHFAEKWEAYRNNHIKRNIALTYKAIFKLLYY